MLGRDDDGSSAHLNFIVAWFQALLFLAGSNAQVARSEQQKAKSCERSRRLHRASRDYGMLTRTGGEASLGLLFTPTQGVE